MNLERSRLNIVMKQKKSNSYHIQMTEHKSGQSFSLPEMPVKYGIIEEWQKRIQVKQDGDRLKQNSKEKKRYNGC